MVRVEWAQPALTDLRDIHEFIARDSPRYAQLTVEKITGTAARLARFPELGEVLPEFPRLAYRQIVVGAYRLVYREDRQRDRVVVMGVIHASRDLPPILENR
ncbi:MAG: type II toxin-antitoxin system RelE/ParE family toxin [Planctomycetota bacterium]|jgi:plasmid stabilization system protein ParE